MNFADFIDKAAKDSLIDISVPFGIFKIYLYTVCMFGICRGLKRISGVLELELQAVVSQHLYAGN